MKKKRVLITGAGGIVGRGIRPYLAERYAELVLVGRSAIAPVAAPDLDVIRVADQEARAFVRSYFHF